MDPPQQQQQQQLGQPRLEPEPARSILTIDLNQIPSPPETLTSPTTFIVPSPTSLVRSFHYNPALPEGAAAEIPIGDSACGVCGGVVVSCDRLVCDGCEKGFHFVCAGAAVLPDEWVCRDCLRAGVSSMRWRLGRTKDDALTRFLDINALPPTDNAAADSRKLCFQYNAYSGYASGGTLSYPEFMHSSNGFGFQKALSAVKQTVGLDFQDFLHNNRSIGRSFEDLGRGSQLRRSRSSNTAFRLPSLNLDEVLQSLREFVSERHGLLEEGWRVEFRQSKNGYETYAVYCAPDGKIFETMSDVANYLGLASNNNTTEPDLKNEDGSALRKNGLHVPKRRKLTKLPVGNGFVESTDILTGRFSNGFVSHMMNGQFSMSNSERKSVATESVQEVKELSDVHQFHEGLPLQYDDFFVLSLGKVDTRISYHGTSQISPVGYRSCWHDKITGSLFLCDVLDGGDSGPVFKVRRFSCSALPIPYGSTILQSRSYTQSNVPPNKEINKITISDEECCIEKMLSDPCVPVEGDCLSWLLSTPSVTDGPKANHPESDVYSPVGEEIGEISVDGNSSSAVWRHLSQKLADACRELYKQSGTLKFFCKHANEGVSSSYDIINDKNKDMYSSLHKFCSLLGSLKVPTVVKNDDELDSTVDAIQYWLDSDRFGLDVEFVQELIEQLPDVRQCSRYESLKRRNAHLKAPLAQNGLLLINGRSIELCRRDTVIDSLYKKHKSSLDIARDIHSRPPGKHFGGKLPPYLVGDVLQVWESMHRFEQILSLVPLNFDELEAELLSPWFENLPLLGPEGDPSVGKAVYADRDILFDEQILSSSDEIDLLDGSRCIEMPTATFREDALVQLNPAAYSKCTGLRRAHMSVLDVLVSELQIKVAAMVDPSIDGETKSRRGRRRDVDSSILAIKPKLNLLPINELTWPELARRYTLAMLSVDGNLDSAETGTRECGKVFRCLQGDGGVLCGSLVGVAGIEADALLLAEATKRIYGCQSTENDHLTVEGDDGPESVSTSGRNGDGDGNIPEWAQVLEPVRKLPTNVGTRIRKCVYEALEKDPPDWARTKLEYSISKEVYKGNASGPTKKAVLSVLADALSEASQVKISKERKKKTIISKSDIVTRQCRILLRRAASADDKKRFCNLLGRNLISTSENDDEGLLGSPAMVPRPLDFRTIDLRLAVGVYGGSHEAFVEDVRELWKNIIIAHADQPELVELAETLSKNFESLYQDEVVVFAGKIEEYSKMEHMSPDAKKEISDVFASTSNIPKAPWDEGVCKVCGVDKDDDSVLLCDTCDAEYHTYCLNPPLARIPDGNWYCPSCVSGVSLLTGNSKGVRFIGRKRRKCHGDGVRNYLEELTRLSAVMEQKDYWDFSVDERTLLLKYLCDEVLNSIVIRQHLEQCFETNADLQPKLRTLYSESKSLKLREDILATKAAKFGPCISNGPGGCSLDGHVDIVADRGICEKPQPVMTERRGYNSSVSVDASQTKGANNLANDISSDSQVKQAIILENQVQDTGQVEKADGASVDNHDIEPSLKRQKFSVHEIDSKDSESSSGLLNNRATEGISSSISNEFKGFCDELKVVQKDLSVLQRSIANTEAQLLKSSVRMEYLGTDSCGRLYWAPPKHDGHPLMIVDGTMALEPKKQGIDALSLLSNPSWSKSDSQLSLGGSSVACPFIYGSGCSFPASSQWVYYNSEDELKELVKSLDDYYPKERELKDSIRHLQKMRFHEIHHPGNQDQVPPEQSMNAEQTEDSNVFATKASTVLECKYGPFFQAETMPVKKRWKRSRGTNNQKLYRCKCFEPVWSSRHHCLSCHSTFYTVDELHAHNDENCKPSSSVARKGKANVDTSEVPKSDTRQHIVGPTEKALTCIGTSSKPSGLIEVQNDGKPSPFKLDEISSKFVTNDSIKELVSGIGLLGSGGAPSFTPSTSLYLSDPALMFKEVISADIDQIKVPEKAVGQSDQIGGKGCIDKKNENSESRKPVSRSLGDRKKFVPCKFTSPMALDAYCRVPEPSLKPVCGVAAHILRQLKICLLDMEAALPERGRRLLKAHPDKRRAWHAFVKGANTIFEMVQATIVLEDMIMTDHLKNEWWYWSSLSAAVNTTTLSSLALRIFALDNAIVYDKPISDLTRTESLKSVEDVDQSLSLESSDKSKQGRRSSRRKRDDADG